MSGDPHQKVTVLPLSRVKTIMKSSPDVETVNQESLFMITKATELFIMYLTKLAQRNGADNTSVKYSDLASVVQRKESMKFLHEIVPKKIKFSEYLRMMEQKNREEDNDDGDSGSGTDDDSDSEADDDDDDDDDEDDDNNRSGGCGDEGKPVTDLN